MTFKFTKTCLSAWQAGEYCSCRVCKSFINHGWTIERLLEIYSPIMLHSERWSLKCFAYPESMMEPYRPRLKFDRSLINPVKARAWLSTKNDSNFYRQQLVNLDIFLKDKDKYSWDLLVPQIQARMKRPNATFMCININLY